MKTSLAQIAAMALALLHAFSAETDGATLLFNDPLASQGDQISLVGDITSVRLDFDLATGAYTAVWTASSLNPFKGNIRFNLNLGNAAVGSQIVALDGFFSAQQPATQLSYSGVSSDLTLWHPGDTIVTSGAPPTFTTSFYSGIVDLDSNDILNRDIVRESAVIPAPGSRPPQLLAQYTFAGTAADCTGNSPPMELRNTTFANGTLCLNGIYEGNYPEGFHAIAKIANFSYESFTVALDFFAADFTQNNILTGGSSYRWFSLRHNAGKLEVTLNNQALVYLIPDSQLKLSEWQSLICSVDAAARRIIVALDGQRLGEIVLSPDFHFDVVGSPAESSDRLFTFANYGNGSAFHGYVDNLKVWSRALSSTELDAMLSSPALTIQKAVIVSWPKFPAGYVLQGSSKITGPYQDYTGSIFIEANQFSAAVPLCSPEQFFRVVKP